MSSAAFLKTVRETKTSPGSAVLWWLGQMGFLIKIGETILCIDYFASIPDDPEMHPRQTPPPIPAEDLTGVDLFLGTHDHLDHIDHPAWQIWNRNCPDARFIFPEIRRSALLADGLDNGRLIGMNEGGTFSFGDVTIMAVASAHEFLNRDEETGLYPYLQYIIEGNGVRIWHAGDTLRYEGMLAKLQSFGKIDAAILPINGRDAKRYRNNWIGNMTYQEAVDLTGELRPGTVIPGHWDMFPNNAEDPHAFEDYLDAKYSGAVKCVVPEYLEEIWIK